jgi:uncharacterized RDD family membrane protein YckC
MEDLTQQNTPAETSPQKRAPIAVFAGLAMLIAFAASCMLTIYTWEWVFLKISSTPDINQFYYENEQLHCIKIKLDKISLNTFINNRITVTVLVYNDGAWEEILELDDLINSCSHQSYGKNGYYNFRADEALVIQNNKIKETIAFSYDKEYHFVETDKGLAALHTEPPDKHVLTLFDYKLNKISERTMKSPDYYVKSRLTQDRFIYFKGKFWLFWDRIIPSYYAQIMGDGFAETSVTIEDGANPEISIINDRLIILFNKNTGPGNQRDDNIYIMEFDGQAWTDLPTVELPSDSNVQFNLIDINGVLNIFYWGSVNERRELRDNQWVKVDMPFPPGAGQGWLEFTETMPQFVFYIMFIPVIYFNAVPFLFALMVGLFIQVLVYDDHDQSRVEPPDLENFSPTIPAGLDSRSTAMFIDMFLILSAILVPGIFWIYDMEKITILPKPLTLLALVLIITPVYFTILEGVVGKTIGKYIMGIKVVMTYGGKLTLSASIIRNLVRLLDLFIFFMPGVISMALSEKNQRMGDRYAKSMVIIEHSKRQRSA